MEIESHELPIYRPDKMKFEINKVELSSFEAVITHYLNNNQISDLEYSKEGIFDVINNYIKDYPSNEYKVNNVSKIALQQLLFDFKNVPFPSPENYAFTFIDLFAGVGGFRLGLQNIGGKCLFSSEWNTDAQKTYKSNFGDVPFGDITKQEIKNYIPKNFDLLCAGFPCQAFSIAGYRKGFADTRGTLFFDIEKIIEKHRPKAIFLENVKNLQSHDSGKTFKVMMDVLENKLGYKIKYHVLNSMTHANIPQNRERIFIVGFDPYQIGNYDNFNFPAKIPLEKNINDIIHLEKQKYIYYYQPTHRYFPILQETVERRDTIYQWRRVYVRENKSNVCPTLTANMGSGGHNVPIIKDDFGIRKLTPRECFSFQGYPEKFLLPSTADSKLYMQAGNSVTVPLIQRIGLEILKIIGA